MISGRDVSSHYPSCWAVVILINYKDECIPIMIGLPSRILPHSSEERGLRSTFLSGKMLQNLPYLYIIYVFHLEHFWILPYECPGLCDINRGIHRVKLKNALNENRKKLRRFSFSINMTNYETFCRTKKLISNLFFLKSNMK